MAKSQKNILIPFKNGEVIKRYQRPYWIQKDYQDGIEWVKNHEFYASMRFVGIDRGKYSDRMVLENQDTGKTFHVHMIDFMAMMPYFRFGVITGTFTFKRFNNKYGVRFVK